MRIRFLFLLITTSLFWVSCSRKNLAYLSDVKHQAEYIETITNAAEPRIRTDDLLSITVTSLNPEANSLFNRGEMPVVGNTRTASNSAEVLKEGYLVDKEGFIDFPVLGKIKLEGLTKAEAKSNITLALQDYLKEPIVNIRYLNYKITVIGEVSKPGSFTIPSEKVNILEALGMAGDMTVFGKRNNVLIIREESGVRKLARLDLTSKDLLNSSYFYLQQNDVVYVEPNNAKVSQSSLSRSNISLGLSAMSLIVLIITRLF